MTSKGLIRAFLGALAASLILGACGGGDGSEGIVGTGQTEKKQVQPENKQAQKAEFQYDGSIHIVTE